MRKNVLNSTHVDQQHIYANSGKTKLEPHANMKVTQWCDSISLGLDGTDLGHQKIHRPSKAMYNANRFPTMGCGKKPKVPRRAENARSGIITMLQLSCHRSSRGLRVRNAFVSSAVGSRIEDIATANEMIARTAVTLNDIVGGTSCVQADSNETYSCATYLKGPTTRDGNVLVAIHFSEKWAVLPPSQCV